MKFVFKLIRMKNNYDLQNNFYSVKLCTDSHYFLSSTTGGGILYNPMTPRNGVVEIVKPIIEIFCLNIFGNKAHRTVKPSD